MIKKDQVDFIIVGQGLAGSLLAWHLLKAQCTIHIFDNHFKGASSKIAAGIVNPITGRRFAKSWLFDEIQVYNIPFYKQLEKELNISIFSERKVLRFLENTKDKNEWDTRSGHEEKQKYMETEADWETLKPHIRDPFAMGQINQAAQVDMPLLIRTLKDYFLKGRIMTLEKFDYEGVSYDNESITYSGIKAKKIIFCEGHKGRFNPFFKYLPFEPSKGEVLILRVPELKTEKIFKDKLIFAPLGNDLYWCGSNYEWNAIDDEPTEKRRLKMLEMIEATLKIPFEVVNHLAAIRPTVYDRRPLIGIHPGFAQLAIFNGLGTKGASLAPYWSDHFTKFLLHNNELHQEVDILRFEELIKS